MQKQWEIVDISEHAKIPTDAWIYGEFVLLIIRILDLFIRCRQGHNLHISPIL